MQYRNGGFFMKRKTIEFIEANKGKLFYKRTIRYFEEVSGKEIPYDIAEELDRLHKLQLVDLRPLTHTYRLVD